MATRKRTREREPLPLAAGHEVEVEQLPVQRLEAAQPVDRPGQEGDEDTTREGDEPAAAREGTTPREKLAQRRSAAQVRLGLQRDTAIPTGLRPTDTLSITRCVPVSMTAS